MSEPIIKVNNVSRHYSQGELTVKALRGVDLEIEAGEFAALAGPSGSGKTTLLNLIGCLDTPTGGTISVSGVDTTSFSKSEAAKFRLDNIGFVFQAYNLIPVLSAFENAEFVMMLQGEKSADERRRVIEELFKRVGLDSESARRPNQLSGGQQQRVAVVRAIASKPVIVLADEPTANLDSQTSSALLDLMYELNQSEGITFLFSTHDPLVMQRASRLIRLDSGNIVDSEMSAA